MIKKETGIGFYGLLQIVFIVLKLCGIISWSWFVVFLPTIVTTVVWIIAAFIIFNFLK